MRSTTQRRRPRPEPCSVLRRAISGLIPRWTEFAAVLVVVVAAVGDQARRVGGAAGRPAAHRRHPVEQRDQLGDVVAVAAGDRPGERDPGRVDQEVVLGAGSGSINRARARRGAPFFACTWLRVGDRPRPLDLARRAQLGQQQRVQPLPHARPAATHPDGANRSTPNRSRAPAADAATRSPCAARTRSPAAPADPAAACGPDSASAAPLSGSSGSTSSHNSSDTTHGAEAIGTPPSLTTDADGFVVSERVPSFRFEFLGLKVALG